VAIRCANAEAAAGLVAASGVISAPSAAGTPVSTTPAPLSLTPTAAKYMAPSPALVVHATASPIAAPAAMAVHAITNDLVVGVWSSLSSKKESMFAD